MKNMGTYLCTGIFRAPVWLAPFSGPAPWFSIVWTGSERTRQHFRRCQDLCTGHQMRVRVAMDRVRANAPTVNVEAVGDGLCTLRLGLGQQE